MAEVVRQDSAADEALRPSIAINNTETRDEQISRYTVYKVCVSYGGTQWFVFRRYNEFHRLYEHLREKFPEVSWKLPPKRVFGNLKPGVVEERRHGLHDFIQQVLCHNLAIKQSFVQEFFRLRGDACERLSQKSQDSSSSSNNDPDSAVGSLSDYTSEDSQLSPGRDAKGRSSSSDPTDDDSFDLGPKELKRISASDFKFTKMVGKGTFGKVFLAVHLEENKTYAVKVIEKSAIRKRSEATHVMSERDVLVKHVDHPFLVKLHYCFRTPRRLYFVLDYVCGGELFYHLQREQCFPEAKARFYAAEIASAIGYLHSKDIIYRDLKPENLLLDVNGHVVLTDFGLCKEGIDAHTTTNTFCGTPEYLAPEVIEKKSYDRTVDWWCYGCVLYEMLFGLPPFYSKDRRLMYDYILRYRPHYPGYASSAAKGLLTGLLRKNPRERTGCRNDVQEIQEADFFSEIDWEALDRKELKPPFNPEVKDPFDLHNFDQQFTKEAVPESIGKSPTICATVSEVDDVFHGFSYAPPLGADLDEC